MDPFSTLLTLLRPRAAESKLIEGPVAYERTEQVGFGLVLEGECRLEVGAGDPLELRAGDFVLLPPNDGFRMHGPHYRMLGGYFAFEAGQADLLSNLLPGPLRVGPQAGLSEWVQLVAREATAQRPGRELILQKLVEILLIEAIRNSSPDSGLLRGLADPALTEALHSIHQQPAYPWTLAELAARAGCSRSAFCQNFSRTIGLAPKEYLILWRMAVAKDLLGQGVSLKNVAESVGYQSASAFSTAFRRQFQHAPGSYVVKRPRSSAR